MKVVTLGPSSREVTFADGTRVLYSYETPVAAYVPGYQWSEAAHADLFLKSEHFHSRTTSAHVAKWLRMNWPHVQAQSVPQERLLALVEAR